MGSHIDTLLLRFFIMYLPELITAGKVYRAVPPLFGIKGKGGNMKYFTTKLDFTKYIQNLFANTHVLTDINGRRLTNSETTNLFFKNIDYKDQMESISNTFAVDPDLLESVLYHLARFIEIGNPEAVASMAAKVKAAESAKKSSSKKTDNTKRASKPKQTKVTKKEEEISDDGDFNMEDIPITENSVSASVAYYIKPTFSVKALRAELKKAYRFIDIVEENGVIRIEGLVNSRYQYVFINDKFIASCIPIIEVLKNNTDLYYRVNDEIVSLYSLMVQFDNMIPSGLIRYKGLGEQNPDQLATSALHPKGDRTLIRYTIESAKEEIENLRRIDSSMASLLREVRITKAEIE